MTAATSGVRDTPARILPVPWVRAAKKLVGAQLVSGAWTWGILLVVGSVAIAILSSRDLLEISVFQFARYAGLWFGFTLALISALTVSLHVAAGLTRRSFVQATLVTALVSGVLYAVVLGIVLEAEGVVYRGIGVPQAGGEASPAFDPAAGFATVPGLAVSFVAGQISGLVVGMGYYRFGGLRGTAFLPVALAPIYLVGTESLPTGQVQLLGWLDVPTALAVALAVVVLALAAYGYHLLTRAVPIARVVT